MCERPKIHVFLGAPPPSTGPAVVSGAGVEDRARPPADWRHLELSWQDGRLRPATGEAFRDPAGGVEKPYFFTSKLFVGYIYFMMNQFNLI